MKLRPWFAAWLLSSAAGLFAASWGIIQNSQGSGRAVALGVSAQSLVLAFLTGLLGVGFLALGIVSL